MEKTNVKITFYIRSYNFHDNKNIIVASNRLE